VLVAIPPDEPERAVVTRGVKPAAHLLDRHGAPAVVATGSSSR